MLAKAATVRARRVYDFGPFRLDPAKRLLLREGDPVPITPKAFDILLLLVQNPGRLVPKQDLLKAVWPDTVVEENNLTVNMSSVRKALGERAHELRYIATIPGRGYSFVVDVKEQPAEGTDGRTAEAALPGEGLPSEALNLGMTAAPPQGEAGADPTAGRSLDRTRPPLRRPAMAVTALLVTMAGIGPALVWISGWRPSQASPPEFIQLTTTGNIGGVLISPDGKFIVYNVVERGRQSLWLRQTQAVSSQQIVAPSDTPVAGIAISPDGEHLYLLRPKGEVWSLYRMPLLGGIPVKLVDDMVGIAVTLSPDGRRLAFLRNDRLRQESALIVANADGTGERKLATRPLAEPLRSPAWSPDGKTIAFAAGTAETSGKRISVGEIRVEDGVERQIGSRKWGWVAEIAWLSDGSELVLAGARTKEDGVQLWRLSRASGTARKITNEVGRYRGVSLTADSRTLVTVKVGQISDLWVAREGDTRQARRLDVSNYRPVWTPDGRIVYASAATGNTDLWIMETDGTRRTQLTTNAGVNWDGAVSRDGRHIAFVSDRAGVFNIWRMDMDGGNPVRLTDGGGEKFPEWSADGEWIVYASVDDWTLWKVPRAGGKPVRLTGPQSRNPAISPDGKWIAHAFRDPRGHDPWKIAVTPFAGGAPVKIFDLPATAALPHKVQWTDDGRAFLYIDGHGGVSNVWRQPLDGSPPRQVTRFESEGVLFFDWSPDGKQLVCILGRWTGDIVMVKNP